MPAEGRIQDQEALVDEDAIGLPHGDLRHLQPLGAQAVRRPTNLTSP